MKRTVATYALAALAAFVFFGCKTATEPGTGGTVTVVHPGVGSTYTYHSTSKDSTGAVTNESNYTMTVVDTNATIGGRTRVVKMMDVENSDSTYLFYESNGDVSIYEGDPAFSGNGAMWVKLPFSGGTGMTATLFDSTADFFDIGLPIHMVTKMSTTSAGSESITTAGSTFNTRKAKIASTVQMTATGMNVSSTDESYFWLAPTIGNLVKIESPSSKDPMTDETSDSKIDILTSYSLK